jgi:type VI protein secretion system component VasK
MGVFTVLLGIVVVALIGGISSVVRGHDLSDSTMRFSVVAVLVVGALVAAWSWYSTHSKLAARRVQGAQSSQAADARATAEAEEARRRQEAEAAHRRRLADAKRDVMSAVWWYHHVGPPTPETVKVHALAHLDDILADAKGIEHRHHTSPLADLAWRRELAAHAAEDWCEELDRPHTASELSDILAARWRFDMECLEAAKRLDQERRLASRVPEELTHHDEARRADIYFETEAQRRVSIETRLAEARRQAEAFKERLLLDQVPEDEAQRLARRRLQQLRGPILETARAAGILDYEDESADI